jgi:hypothetical protein
LESDIPVDGQTINARFLQAVGNYKTIDLTKKHKEQKM